MMEIRDDDAGLRALSPEEIERDRRIEVLLDECVASCTTPGPELTAAILAARPFAPWEIRKARAWRVPAVAASGLLVASLGFFLAPLWSLGPVAAMDLWVRVIAASTSGALGAALAAGPALADAAGRAVAGTDGLRPALAGLLLLSGGSLALVARRLAKRPGRVRG